MLRFIKIVEIGDVSTEHSLSLETFDFVPIQQFCTYKGPVYTYFLLGAVRSAPSKTLG